MKESKNFIETLIDQDLSQGLSESDLKFRFPPEPNGFLHIGHVKAIWINFTLAKKYKAPVVLRFDDTNPEKEEQQYIDAIKKDISWLGYKWNEERFASDYFNQLYLWAVDLISNNKAYVDTQSSSEIAEQKGTPTSAGSNSPYRERSVEENLRLFQ
ncbi:MAG: glutamine--tRNA ligase, partial [Flavobacteriaceae bacterium]|nr:glutamine--tRNA ligase [Flavobacteriaceae bacterium]